MTAIERLQYAFAHRAQGGLNWPVAFLACKSTRCSQSEQIADNILRSIRR